MQVADIPLELIDHNDNTPAHLAAKYGHLNCLQVSCGIGCNWKGVGEGLGRD